MPYKPKRACLIPVPLGTCFAPGPHIEVDFTSVFLFSPTLSLVVANGDVSRVQQTVDRVPNHAQAERATGEGGGGRGRGKKAVA